MTLHRMIHPMNLPTRIRRLRKRRLRENIEIGDRARAIGNIISKLKTDDILLIAGKGHEDYQVIGKEVIELSDIKIAHLCLENSKIDR